MHDLSQSNVLLPPSLSHSVTSASNELNVDLIDDSGGEDVSNDNIHIQFNRGSHQNLVELQNDKPFRDMSATNDGMNDNINDENSFCQTVLSRVRN